MNLELKEFQSLDSYVKHTVARLVSAYTHGEMGEKPQMLPVTIEDVYQKRMGYVALDGGNFAGYIGAEQPVEHNECAMTEVGTLWVPGYFRRQGIAGKLILAVTNKLVAAGELPYAFVNPSSEPIFKKEAYVHAEPDLIPAEAFLLCAGCTHDRMGKICCDETVIYMGQNNG